MIFVSNQKKGGQSSGNIQNMLKGDSTLDSCRNSSSDIPLYWEQTLPSCCLKFQLKDNLLKVEVLSISDFRYYYRAFFIEEPNCTRKRIPLNVVRGLVNQYYEVEFKKGVLMVSDPAEQLRNKREYCFPPLLKLQLRQDIFSEIAGMRQLQSNLQSSKKRIKELQAGKKAIFAQMKRMHQEHCHPIQQTQHSTLFIKLSAVLQQLRKLRTRTKGPKLHQLAMSVFLIVMLFWTLTQAGRYD